MGSGFGAERDVLGHSHRLDQHKMLMDHTDAKRDRVMGRLDIAHLAIDDDLATVCGVKTVGNTHRRRLPGAVFTYDGMDCSRLDDDIDTIISENVAKAFCYLSEF